MTEESANWCRFAQLIINTGSKVVRVFFQQKIVADVFRDYSAWWRDIIEEPKFEHSKILWAKFSAKFNDTNESSDTTIKKLLYAWRGQINQHTTTTIAEQIDQLQHLKSDIAHEDTESISADLKVILKSWFSQIEMEILQLKSRCAFISKWNDSFLILLYKSQNDLYTQVEANENFQKQCSAEIRSVTQESHSAVQQSVERLRNDLQVWRDNCDKVLMAFETKCDNLITSGLEECQGDAIIAECLNTLKNNIKCTDLQLKKDIFYGSWCSDIHNVFDKLEKGNYEEAISSLDEISSFKDMKIRQFFKQLVCYHQTEKSKYRNEMFSKLKGISSAKGVEDLDLTCLVYALKESKTVTSQPLEDLHDWYTSPCIDILRLKAHRNDIVAHIKEAKLSKDYFEVLWKNVKALLCRIANRCGEEFETNISQEIDAMAMTPLEPDMITKMKTVYIRWCKKDVQIDLPSPLVRMMESIETAELKSKKDARAVVGSTQNAPARGLRRQSNQTQPKSRVNVRWQY